LRPTTLSLYLALRYLRSTRRDAFASFLSLTAAGGIALGVAALILALGALSGFQRALRAEILDRTPEIEIRLGAETDREALREAVLTHQDAKEAQWLLRGKGWLRARGRVRPVELVGYESRLPASFPRGEESAGKHGLFLGDRLASVWGLQAGDPVEVISARPGLTPLGPQPRVRRIAVAGTFSSGRTEQEERLALPLEEARDLLGENDLRLQVSTGSLDRALGLSAALASELSPAVEVLNWQDLNRGLFFALKLEKAMMFLAVFLIVAVASLALVSDLSLIIASKQSEIGILGAMGTTASTVRRVFLWVGGLLAAAGVLLGGTVGLSGAWLLDRFQVLRLPSQVYFLDHVPFLVRPLDLLVVVMATLLLALSSTGYAAARAAALEPVEALRR
jgi:lipoprotein-releasing system permease protein